MTQRRAGYITSAGVIARLLELEGACTVLGSRVVSDEDKQTDVTRGLMDMFRTNPTVDRWDIGYIVKAFAPDQEKAVRSAVDYLTRTGRLERVERGVYAVRRDQETRPPGREAVRDAMVMRAYAEGFGLARRKIEDLLDEIEELKAERTRT